MFLGVQQLPILLHRGVGHSLVIEIEPDPGTTFDPTGSSWIANICDTPGGALVASFEVDDSELVSDNRLTLTLADTWADTLAASATELSWDLVRVPPSGPKELWILPSPVSVSLCNADAS